MPKTVVFGHAKIKKVETVRKARLLYRQQK
jgi:hypothetical protein